MIRNDIAAKLAGKGSVRPGYPALVHGAQDGGNALRDECMSPRQRRRLSGSLLVTLYLGSTLGAAHGQSTGSENPVANMVTANRNCVTNPACHALFEQAQQQSKSGQLAEALHSYSLAYQVTPDPRLLFSLGRVQHKRGQLIEAIRYYRQFLASDADDEVQKATARGLVADCEAALPPISESPVKPGLDPLPAKPVTAKPLAIH